MAEDLLDIEEQDGIDDTEDALYEHLRLVVDKGQFLLRIDKFLMTRVPNATRTKIQYGIDAGSIVVNEKPVKSNYKVKPFDVITAVFAYPPRTTELIPENIPLDIMYEDEDIIIINKKAGMVVHPGYGNYSGTLVNALLYHFNHLPSLPIKSTNNDERDTIRPGLVHRIDKNTSGIIVLAKNEYSLSFLAKQFADHSIKRKYVALAWGSFDTDAGTITGHVGRSLRNRKIMDVFPNGDNGRHAVTHYKVIENLGYVTLIECQLETGRTHQIRVHMQHVNHNLFNDETYGGHKILRGNTTSRYKQFVENCFEIMPRHALHAKSLGFIHPRTKEEVFFESELPNDLMQVIEKWRKYYTNQQINQQQ